MQGEISTIVQSTISVNPGYKSMSANFKTSENESFTDPDKFSGKIFPS
jgi:hypothetical protein